MSRHRRNLSYSRSLSRRRSWSRNSRSRSRSPPIYSDRHGADRYNNDKYYKQDSHVDAGNLDSTSGITNYYTDYKLHSTNARSKDGPKARPWGRPSVARSSVTRRYIDHRQFIVIRDLPSSLWDREELGRILSKQSKPKEFTLNDSDKSVLADYGSSDQAISAYKDLSHRLKGCKLSRTSLEDWKKDNHNNKYESEDFREKSKKITSLESMKRNLIEKYSAQLKELVSSLSTYSGDEKSDLLDQVHKLKNRIKILSMPKLKTQRYQHSIDNRPSTLVFESLPECAQGRIDVSCRAW